jgi:hypothetical protein
MHAPRPRSSRQILTVTLALVIVACGAAIAIPARRPELLAGIFTLGCAGWLVSEGSRSRRQREARATRVARFSRDDIPAHVVDLLLAGKKIQAIKCYREQTGSSLKEAKDLIDSL